jgi:hypothetical protein
MEKMENIKLPPQMQANPLKQYFRSIKFYMALPSGTSYYEKGIIEFNDSGEVGIMPMTGKDELILKNPDALLNGEALVEVIKSCVPAIKNPKILLTNDIEALITAIRYATFNDGLETQLDCPACGHENTFKLNLQYAIENMEYLEPEYVVNLANGLTVFVKPYSYTELIKGLHAQFEQSKVTKSIESSSLTEEEKMKIFGQVFKDLAKLTVELLVSSIVRIVDESNNINVTDKKFIAEFVQNIDRTSVNQLEDLIKEINEIGIKRTFGAKCEKCNHPWESEIDFNPVNFS